MPAVVASNGVSIFGGTVGNVSINVSGPGTLVLAYVYNRTAAQPSFTGLIVEGSLPMTQHATSGVNGIAYQVLFYRKGLAPGTYTVRINASVTFTGTVIVVALSGVNQTTPVRAVSGQAYGSGIVTVVHNPNAQVGDLVVDSFGPSMNTDPVQDPGQVKIRSQLASYYQSTSSKAGAPGMTMSWSHTAASFYTAMGVAVVSGITTIVTTPALGAFSAPGGAPLHRVTVPAALAAIGSILDPSWHPVYKLRIRVPCLVRPVQRIRVEATQ